MYAPSHLLQEPEGFAEFVGGADFCESGESPVEEDVVLVAGEHEFLARDFDVGDIAAGGDNLDFVGDEQVAGGARQGAEAVNPLPLEVVDVVFCQGFGELGVAGHAGLGALDPGLGDEGADEFIGIGAGGEDGLAHAEEVGLQLGIGTHGGGFPLQALNGLPQQLAVELEADGGDMAALLGAEQVAGAADFKVAHGYFEAAAQLGVLLDGRRAFAGVGGAEGIRRE